MLSKTKSNKVTRATALPVIAAPRVKVLSVINVVAAFGDGNISHFTLPASYAKRKQAALRTALRKHIRTITAAVLTLPNSDTLKFQFGKQSMSDLTA
jgi:hypothetical protein